MRNRTMRRQIALAVGGCLAAAAAGLAQQSASPTTPASTPYQSPFAVGKADNAPPTMLPPATIVAQPLAGGQYTAVQPIQTYTIQAGQQVMVPAQAAQASQPMALPTQSYMIAQPVAVPAQPMAIAQQVNT